MFASGTQQQQLASVQLQASADGQSNFYTDPQTGAQLQANVIYAIPGGGSSYMNVSQGGAQQTSDTAAFMQQAGVNFNAQQQFAVQGADANGGMQQQSAIMTVGSGAGQGAGVQQFGMSAANFGMAGNQSGQFGSAISTMQHNASVDAEDPNALCADTVYMSNLPAATKHEDLYNFCTQVGNIKTNRKTGKPMIWIFQVNGAPRGDATVTFEDIQTAANAAQYLDQKNLGGNTLSVSICRVFQKPNYGQPPRGGGGGGGGFGMQGGQMGMMMGMGGASAFPHGGRSGRGRGGSGGRGGRHGMNANVNLSNMGMGGMDGSQETDWVCPQCTNVNFGWRAECNRCKVPKPDNATPSAVNVRQLQAGRGGGTAMRSNNGGGFGGGMGMMGGGGQMGGRGGMRSGRGGNGGGMMMQGGGGMGGGPMHAGGGQRGQNRMRPY